MRVLVLGGTAWLSSQVATHALTAGHQVTCLARGVTGAFPPGVRPVCANRDQTTAYDGVATADWDVVVDVSRQPHQVKGAVSRLVDRCGRYVIVSTGNVYADHKLPGRGEDRELLPALPEKAAPSMEVYGEAKVACEQHVRREFGDERSVIARVGLIGGPGDTSDRSGYWPMRFSRPASPEGAVLAPDAPELPTQVVDVRDLAAWLLDAALLGVAGTFNVTGETLPLREHLDVAREVAQHTGVVVWAQEAWLLEQGVSVWMGERSLPLWIDDPDWRGFSANDSSRARAAGLVNRPLHETLADTLAWERTRDRSLPRRAGLSDADERELLGLLAADRR